MDDSIFLDHIENFQERDHIYEVGDKVIKHAMNFRPTVSYNYLNFDLIEKYCFNHTDFTADDFKLYFSKIKKITSMTFDELTSNKDKTLDFTVYDSPNKELKNVFSEITGNKTLRAEQTPNFGRIALYNSEKAGDKAPRIFFIVGHYCVLHILFFDPFHDIYKGEK